MTSRRSNSLHATAGSRFNRSFFPGMRAIQEDLCWRVVYLWYFNGCVSAEIADTLFISTSTVKRVLGRFKRNECIYLDHRRRAPRQDKRLLRGDLEILRRLVEDDASMYLDEIQHELRTRTGRNISLPTICRCLRHELRITRKLLTARVRGVRTQESGFRREM